MTFWSLIWRLAQIGAVERWEPSDIDVTKPAVRKMIARAILDRRREAGAMICWSYSRDRQVERFWLWAETPFQKKKRLIRARLDKATATPRPLRLVG